MEWRDDQDKKDVFESVKGSLLMLCFGLGVLMFLVGIKQTEWFHLRPASGTAAAMSNASATEPDEPNATAQPQKRDQAPPARKAAAHCSKPGAQRPSDACTGMTADS